MIGRPLSRWSCRGFRASSPSSRPSRSESATDGTSSVAISPRRGAMPSSAVPSSTGCAPSSPKPALAKAGGDKALVGNSGFRRYLKTVSAEHFAVDETRVAEDARFDGLYVLRTNTKLTPLQVMLRYRDLLRVEQLFRQAKAVLATRPIYHSSDMAIRGHVFCSFLARLQEIELEQDGKRFLLRTPTTGVAGKLFQAVGVALPPNLQELPLTTPQ